MQKKAELAVVGLAALCIAFTAGFFAGRAGVPSAVTVERGGMAEAAASPEVVYVTLPPEVAYVTVAPALPDGANAAESEGTKTAPPLESAETPATQAPAGQAPSAASTSAVVPATPEAAPDSAAPEPHYAADGKLRINYATAAELETLPGIGSTLAARILEYREAHGRFKTVASVKNVSGIGDGRYQQIKDFITAE